MKKIILSLYTKEEKSMKRKIMFILAFAAISIAADNYMQKFETDTIITKSGSLEMTFIGHGTLLFKINKTIIHIDPVSWYADYSKMPKADLILITHHHGDHLDKSAAAKIIKKDTKIICSASCKEKLEQCIVLKNGDSADAAGFKIEAVPAYNIVHKRDDGSPFHPKGIGNGYVLTIDDQRIYIGGDTEVVPEMKNLKDIDIAFLPVNLPYTMTPAMAASAVHMLNPKIFYPYHFGETNLDELVNLLKDKKDCEIRIRKLK